MGGGDGRKWIKEMLPEIRLDKEVMGNYSIYFHPVLWSQSRSRGAEIKLPTMEPEPNLRIAAPPYCSFLFRKDFEEVL
jgi:hypothetical protein